MKKIIALCFLLTFTILAQNDNSKPFSKLDFGILGGFNLQQTSKLGGDFHLELKANLTSNFILFSAGYFKTYKPVIQDVKTYGKAFIDNDTIYQVFSIYCFR